MITETLQAIPAAVGIFGAGILTGMFVSGLVGLMQDRQIQRQSEREQRIAGRYDNELEVWRRKVKR